MPASSDLIFLFLEIIYLSQPPKPIARKDERVANPLRNPIFDMSVDEICSAWNVGAVRLHMKIPLIRPTHWNSHSRYVPIGTEGETK
jgi:hypothetical protein